MYIYEILNVADRHGIRTLYIPKGNTIRNSTWINALKENRIKVVYEEPSGSHLLYKRHIDVPIVIKKSYKLPKMNIDELDIFK